MEQDILKMYDVVFKDIVKGYIEDYNEAVEDNKIELTEEEIDTIVYNIINKNDYLWDYIFGTIKSEVQEILKEKETE